MDFLGNELTPGAIVIYSSTRRSGFFYGVVSKVGRGRVQITQGYDSRKDNDNVVVITEEQLIQGVTAAWMPKANEDGNYVRQMYRGRGEDGRAVYENIVTPIDEKIRQECAKYIRKSRELKGEPLGEWEPTLEELANQ